MSASRRDGDRAEDRTLDQKVALVTGASGGGVGTATAQLLAARGASVIVNYRQNQTAADETVAGIVKDGGQALAVQADVTDERQVGRMVAEAVDAYGRIDILVNNAALPFVMGPIMNLTWEQFSSGLQARVHSALVMTQAVVPVMRSNGGGRLIYVGSEHADGPSAPGMIVNGASAAALVAFAQYAAYELGSDGITANVVSPGGIDSPETARMIEKMGLPPEFIEHVLAGIPLGRQATVADVAGVIAFFASDDAAFMTGTVAHLNGGVGIARSHWGDFVRPQAAPSPKVAV